MSTAGSSTRSRSSVSVRRISPAPGRNASTEPGSARSARAAASATCRSIGAARIAAEIARLDRKGAALALDHRRVAEQLRHPRAVDASPTSPGACRSSRRPCCTSRASARPRSASSERSWNSSNSTAATPSSDGIVEHHAGEHALGDDLDARPARHLRAEAHAIADGLADLLAERRRHARGRGARREPARLQHDDLLARRPRLVAPAPAAPAWSCRRPAARPAPRQLRARSAAVSAGSASSIGKRRRCH